MNYTSRNARLFPIDLLPLSKKQIAGIIEIINVDANCLYNWNEKGNYLDVLYVTKKSANYFLDIDRLLSVFHYWQIDADEGFAEDTIMGQSKFYPILDSCEILDYYNTCYYKVDKIKVNGIDDNKEMLFKELDNKMFSTLNGINDFTFEQNINMTYTASNDRWKFSEEFNTNKEIKLGSRLISSGGIISILSNSSPKVGPEQNNIFHYLRDDFLNKPNNTIQSIELLFKDVVTHQILWNINSQNWSTKTGDFWHNCADKEYLKFEGWYKNKLAK